MRPPVFLTAGFRAFFLAAGVFAVVAMAVWAVWLGFRAAASDTDWLSVAPPPHLWHGHEMIFGYAMAVVGGFLLTAVPNWTGQPPAGPRFIMLAAGLWLAGRLAMAVSGILPAWAVMPADLAYAPLLAAGALWQLRKRPKPQNLMIVGILALVWLADLRVHLAWTGLAAGGAEAGLRTGLLTLAALVAIIGGRVTPAFTRNAMTRAGVATGLPRSWPRLEAAVVASALVVAVLAGAGAQDRLIGVAAGLAGALQAARLAFWRGRWTLGQPILWSLHLGLAMLAVGYLALGLAAFGIGDGIAALHLVGIGGIGGMTLAMMSRAALGHAGRPLVAPSGTAVGYGAVALSALVRAGAPWDGAAAYDAALLVAGGLWCLAFGLFLVDYWRLLTGAAR